MNYFGEALILKDKGCVGVRGGSVRNESLGTPAIQYSDPRYKYNQYFEIWMRYIYNEHEKSLLILYRTDVAYTRDR